MNFGILPSISSVHKRAAGTEICVGLRAMVVQPFRNRLEPGGAELWPVQTSATSNLYKVENQSGTPGSSQFDLPTPGKQGWQRLVRAENENTARCRLNGRVPHINSHKVYRSTYLGSVAKYTEL